MSAIWWDLSGTDKRCERYGPGHWVHWIHHRKSVEEPGLTHPVTVSVDDDGLFVLEFNGLRLRGWNHRPQLVHRALQRSGGAAVWLARWKLLVIPTGPAVDGASNVFNLGTVDDQTPCRTTSSPRPDLIPAAWRSAPKPAWVRRDSGLQPSAPYRSGRPRPTPTNQRKEKL